MLVGKYTDIDVYWLVKVANYRIYWWSTADFVFSKYITYVSQETVEKWNYRGKVGWGGGGHGSLYNFSSVLNQINHFAVDYTIY